MTKLPNCVAEEQRQFAEDTVEKLNEDYAKWDASFGEENRCLYCDKIIADHLEYCDTDCSDKYSRAMK